MSSPTVNELVSDYLARLEEAARYLPASRRTELVDEISEHIEGAREAGAASDEAAVRTMLDRLGDPEDIVAAALAEDADWRPRTGTPAAPVGAYRRPGTGLELVAVLMLTVGSLIPVVGWVVGVVLLWASRWWRSWEKLLGTLVVPGGPGLAFWFGSLLAFRTCATSTGPPGSAPAQEAQTCTVGGLPPWLGTSLFVAVMVAPLGVGALLYLRARARAAAQAGHEVDAAQAAAARHAPQAVGPAQPAGRSPWGGTEIAAVALLATSTLFAIALFGPAGLMLALVALVAGLIFVWSSPQWTQREKRIATAITIAPAVLGLLVAVFAFVMSRGV